jgi:peptide/nickel transport system permease protein
MGIALLNKPMAVTSRPRLALPLFGSQATVSSRLMAAGLVITLGFVVMALSAPLMQGWGWLQDPTTALQNPIHQSPGGDHWFGTTRQGYDIFARTLFGSRAAWQVVLLATALSVVMGVPLGMVSGYLGGRLDRALLFFMDTIYTLPGLLLSVTLAFVVGRGVVNAAIVRNHTVSVKTELFIEAAQAMGADPWTVLSRYLFLNVIQSVPVLFTLNAADAILVLGGLGFLGLGLPEQVPEWGADIRQALDALPTGIWWPALFPGLALTLMVTGLSLVGEGLNELMNPLRRPPPQR